MRTPVISILFFLLTADLVSSSTYKPPPQCEAGLCQCGNFCRALEGEQSCCPSKDGYPEHICGPHRTCCGIGCCREGWECGPYDLCYQPDTWSSSLRSDHTSTIITIVRPNPEHPTTDSDISGSLPTASSLGTRITPSETLPGSLIPTSKDDASQTLPVVLTQPNGQVTTLYSTTEEGATSSQSGSTVVTGSDSLGSTSGSQASTSSNPAISTIITGPGEEMSTAVPSTETGSDNSKVTPNPNDRTSLELPGSETGSHHATGAAATSDNGHSSQLSTGAFTTESNLPHTTLPLPGTNNSTTASEPVSDHTSQDEASSTVSAGNGSTSTQNSDEPSSATGTIISPSSGVSTMETETHGETVGLTTDSFTAIPTISDTEPVSSTATSDGSEAPTVLPSTEISTSSPDETKGLESDTDAPTHSASTKTDSALLPTSVPKTQVNGVTSDASVKPTTGKHSTHVDNGATTGAGHITTSRDSDQTSSTIVAVPLITSVSKPEPRDDGFVVPCSMWFFNACIGPISGWGIALPPGTYPPGPPPPISDNPGGGIQINTNRPLPDWPGLTVGPGHIPTFSDEPTACKTESAELCVTSTSYSLVVDATMTSTVTSHVISTCGAVYGCKVQGHSKTITATDITTASDKIHTATSLRTMETWPDMEESDAKLKSIARRAQMDLDSVFGTSTRTAATTTRDASTPTESVWTGTCPAKNGPDPIVLDGKFLDNMGEKCLCEWNTWMKNDKTLEPYTVDQLRDAINDFCDGSRTLRKPVPTGSPDIAINRFRTHGNHGIFIQAGWATPQLWNSTEERCKRNSDLVLADSCKAGLGRFECRGAKAGDLWGGVYYEALDEGGCVRWTLTPAYLPDGSV